MKRTIYLLAAMAILSCKKTTEPVPAIKEPEKPKEIALKASNWASYDAALSEKVQMKLS
jgi:hypothetical protein